MATVSGIKVFKDSIKFPSYIFQVVDYTCPDEPKSTSFHSMIISSSLIYSTGIDFSGGSFTTVYDSDGWANTYYKTVDFGEAEQTVDDVFFSWLDENIVKEPETKTIRTLMINGTVTTEWNGKPVKQVTVDGVTYKMPETSTTYTIKAGTYQAKEELGTTSNFNIDLNFTSNGQSFSDMNTSGITRAPEATFNYDSQIVYMINTKTWINDNYRTIVIDTAQTVTDESFYNWFTANYLPYEEPATYAIEVGTYVGNDTITTTAFEKVGILFSCNGVSYYGMERTSSQLRYYLITDLFNLAYEKSWENVSYRTIQVEKYVTENETFYNWFTTNFEKQEEPALIAFMISGIDYQAEEGMTWSEWVASSYNSGGYTESDGKIMRLRKFVYTPAGSVDSSDVIVPNESYTEETGGGTAS